MKSVVILSFKSVEQADGAKEAIRKKDETPDTVLEAADTWGLARYAVANTMDEIRDITRNLPPDAVKTIFVGITEEGDYEILRDRREAKCWLEGCP